MQEPVSPDAVESMMTAHPDVLQCVVVVTFGDAGRPVLTAHYVLRPAAALSAAELRDYLAPHLRDGMTCVRLRRHAAFPPTHNATVDLRG